MPYPTSTARGPSASPPPLGDRIGAAPETALARLHAHWVYGALPLAVILLALTPLFTTDWPLAHTLAWLTLPAYMLHQYEEHDADRFRLFVNDLLGGPALSRSDVFWINTIGVWAVLSAVIWLTRATDPGWGVVAAWLLLINGAGHLAQAAALRRANPGVWTAIILFLPLGLAILVTLPATLNHQAAAIAIILALHAAIVLRARANLRRAAG